MLKIDQAAKNEACDIECGDRFFRGEPLCRHGRTPKGSMASMSGVLGRNDSAADPPRRRPLVGDAVQAALEDGRFELKPPKEARPSRRDPERRRKIKRAKLARRRNR